MNWLIPSAVPVVGTMRVVRTVLKAGMMSRLDAERSKDGMRLRAWRARNPRHDSNAARPLGYDTNRARKRDPDKRREKERDYYARNREAMAAKAKRYRERVKARQAQ